MGNLNDVIQRISKKNDIDMMMTGEVIEVINDGEFITIDPVDNEEGELGFLYGCKLMVQWDGDLGTYNIPKVSSQCVVLIVDDESYILFSSNSKIILKGKDNGGIVKVGELIDRLNIIEDTLFDHENALSTHTHAALGGATAVATIIPILNPGTTRTSIKDIENPDVLH